MCHGLPLYEEASQCTVQSLNKYSVLRLKVLTQPPVKLIDLLFLMKQSANYIKVCLLTCYTFCSTY